LRSAFFFHGDFLIYPAEISETQTGLRVPLKYIDCFKNPDIFYFPSLKVPLSENVSMITGVSVQEIPDNWKSVPVRQLLSAYCTGDFFGENIEDILRACHIGQWRKESRFCGSCGAENTDAPVQTSAVNSETAVLAVHRICPKCGRLEFPRICPAVITAITDDKNRILLAHNRKFRAGVYSLIAGFTEAGETLEETVAREIREEVNIEVSNIEYIKSQPWPFPNSLMIGFKARYLSGEIKSDGEEIEDAAWFTPDNLPQLPGEGSLSRYLIDEWLESSSIKI